MQFPGDLDLRHTAQHRCHRALEQGYKSKYPKDSFAMNLLQRFLGIVLFRPGTYRSVASDSGLMLESALIVFFVAFLNSVAYTWFNGFDLESISRVITPMVAWFLLGLSCTLIANMFLKVKVQVTGVLRATGYARIFLLVGLVLIIINPSKLYDSIYWNIGTGISAIATVLAIREACNVSIWQAAEIILLSFFAMLVCVTPLLFVLGLK
jgi:hypothetical protein